MTAPSDCWWAGQLCRILGLRVVVAAAARASPSCMSGTVCPACHVALVAPPLLPAPCWWLRYACGRRVGKGLQVGKSRFPQRRGVTLEGQMS